jgi:cardiolipin synthase
VVLHSKCMVVDGHTTLIGSTNIDYRSIEYNLESSVIIRNDTFGGQMHDLFENDVRYSKRINLKEWRRRPRWDRFVQAAVIRARYLL